MELVWEDTYAECGWYKDGKVKGKCESATRCSMCDDCPLNKSL